MILTIGKDFTTDWSVYSSMQVRPGKPRCPGPARSRVAAARTEFPTLLIAVVSLLFLLCTDQSV
jgi:hypothetical protein